MWEKMIRQGLFQKRNEDKMNSKLRVRIIDMDSGSINFKTNYAKHC